MRQRGEIRDEGEEQDLTMGIRVTRKRRQNFNARYEKERKGR